jgi:hypothetical protein
VVYAVAPRRMGAGGGTLEAVGSPNASGPSGTTGPRLAAARSACCTSRPVGRSGDLGSSVGGRTFHRHRVMASMVSAYIACQKRIGLKYKLAVRWAIIFPIVKPESHVLWHHFREGTPNPDRS